MARRRVEKRENFAGIPRRRGQETVSISDPGFLISLDGLFITAYHVMKYCLDAQKEASRFAELSDCSKNRPRLRYLAQN